MWLIKVSVPINSRALKDVFLAPQLYCQAIQNIIQSYSLPDSTLVVGQQIFLEKLLTAADGYGVQW
jgi:hypothetical protein